MNLSVGSKIRLLMIFLVITLVTTSTLSFWTSRNFIGQIDDLAKTQLPGVSNMILSDMMHDGIRANVFKAILISQSGDVNEKKEVKDESIEFATNIKNYISELQKLNLHEDTKKAIDPALPRIEDYVSSAEKIVDLALSGDAEKAKAGLADFNLKFEALEKELGTLGDLIMTDSAESAAHATVIESRAMYVNIISLVIGLVLLVAFFLVIREQQNQLKSIIEKLVNESENINATSKNLTHQAHNLSESTVEQSSAALEEISATVNATEANSRKLDANAKDSLQSASNGKMTIEQMLESMNIINTSNALMGQQIEEGNKRVSEIVSIISEIEKKTTVINDIVFQTKLLSFNASVEAARAGEQGKGFAVVAEEVGKLAEMSGNAAKEISEMLTESASSVEKIVNENKTRVESIAKDSRTKVDQGIQVATKCGTALEEIFEQATSINSLISEITTAVKEQSKGITEVSNAMGLLDQVSNKNAETSRENLKSSEELHEQVMKLEEVILSLSSMMTSSNKNSMTYGAKL